MSFEKVKALAVNAGVWTSKHAPEIFLGCGVVGFVATVVTASHSTVKAHEIIEEHKAELRDIKTARAISSEERYPEEQIKKDIVTSNTKMALNVAKTYALPVGIGVMSIGCFFASYGIMRKRYIALGAAYTALGESFNLYRQRVIEDKGEDADLYYLTGVKPKEITVTNEETGEKEKVKVIKDLNGDTLTASPYMIKFGKYREDGSINKYWQDNAHLNRCYILGHIDYLDRILWARTVRDEDGYVLKRGSVVLNELRDLLGMDPTPTGAVVGWRFSNGEKGCNGYIDRNCVYEGVEIDPETDKEINCFYINPNVDGLIYDLMDKWEEEPWLPTLTPLDD